MATAGPLVVDLIGAACSVTAGSARAHLTHLDIRSDDRLGGIIHEGAVALPDRWAC
jgi:hypothetical protein